MTAEAAAKELLARGEPIPVDLFAGMREPRLQPSTAERCVCCGLDAREECGGEEHGGRRWCSICVGREHHEG